LGPSVDAVRVEGEGQQFVGVEAEPLFAAAPRGLLFDPVLLGLKAAQIVGEGLARQVPICLRYQKGITHDRHILDGRRKRGQNREFVECQIEGLEGRGPGGREAGNLVIGGAQVLQGRRQNAFGNGGDVVLLDKEEPEVGGQRSGKGGQAIALDTESDTGRGNHGHVDLCEAHMRQVNVFAIAIYFGFVDLLLDRLV